MSWHAKKQGGKSYYYRSVRVNGRPVKQYVGTGPHADEAARAVRERRENKETQRLTFQHERNRLSCAETALKELRLLVKLLFRAHLLLGGYHEHRRQWRRRRHCR
jgi:hypothetical protein